MHLHGVKCVTRVLGGFLLAAAPVMMSAQGSSKPATPAASYADSPSRWDFFVGYSYLSPHGTASNGVTPQNIDFGSIYSFSYYFNKYVGVQLEADEHIPNENAYYPACPSCGSTWGNADFSGGGGGVILRYPGAFVTPFAHALVGAQRVGLNPGTDGVLGIGFEGGGGLDLETPLWHHRIAIRIAQVDYQYAHASWTGGNGSFNMAQLSAGLVIHGGSFTPPPQLTVACAVNPTMVFPGDPVTATATVGNQMPKENVIASISGDGINGTTTGTTATVTTGSLSAGTHTVKCDAKEGKPGKEGVKPYQNAMESTATFTVKEFEPPTISCSANPTTLKPGDSSTITATGMSPQNRPLTYTYSASAGTVNGSGSTATFSSTGAPTGPVTITCNVSDDKGHNASAETSVTIEAPPPAPQPKTEALCSITFSTDKKRPTRVDNEAKACLDEVALDLQKQPDAKAVVVGESNAKEKAEQEKMEKREARLRHPKPVENFSAQRAVNAKQYLVTDKGIDPSRITVATGTGDNQQVEDYLVPAGADFSVDVPGTTPVDENTVKPQERKPMAERHHHKKAAM